MKKIAKLAAASLLAVAGSAQAALITEDFEGFATGAYGSLVTAAYSMTSNQSIDIVTNSPWGTNSIDISDDQTFRVDFTGTVDLFSINFGDYGADQDNAIVRAYDSSDNLLGSNTAINPAGNHGQTTLSISAASISYVTFWDQDPFAGIVWWDNMSFNTESRPVSEPATLSLFGLGLMGLGAIRRKAKKA